MAISDAQSRAIAKYHGKFSDIKVRVLNDGTKERYKAQAESKCKSLNAYIVDLIEKDIAENKSAL